MRADMAGGSFVRAAIPGVPSAIAAHGPNPQGEMMRDSAQWHEKALARARFIYLATMRRDGSQSRAVPVWFTIGSDHVILMQTGPHSWQARRIRRGSPVIVAIGQRNGPGFIGKAEVTDDAGSIGQIVHDYPKRYLMARLGIHRPTVKSFQRGERVAIKITPVGALPPSFRARPGAPFPGSR